MSINPIEPSAQQRKLYSGIKLLSILAGGFFLLLVATMLVPSVLNVDYMFTMGAVLIMLPVASLAMGKMWARGLSAERGAVGPIVEGEAQDVCVYIRQRFPANILLEFEESLPAGLTSIPQMPVGLGVQGGGVEFRYSLLPAKRGVFKLGAVKLRVFDPLGVIGLLRRSGNETEVVVYPRPLTLDSWALVAGPTPAGPLREILARPIVGASADFYGTRKYYPGDDLRRIHWKSAARTQELIVKEFSDDVDTTDVLIVIDTKLGSEASDGIESSLDYACRAAAYIAERTLSMNGAVSLATAATPGVVTSHAGSMRDLPLILDSLARTAADSELPLSDVLLSLDSRVHKNTAIVVISSQVDDALRRAVGRLFARGAAIGQVYVEPSLFESRRRDSAETEYMLDPRIPCWRVMRGGMT